jgi:hypothetical protein
MIDPQFQPKSVLQSMMDALSRNDNVFEHFARTVNGRLGVNHHNRPSRAITVAGADAVVRQIEVSAVLKDPKRPMSAENWAFLVGIGAWKDTPRGRYSRSARVRLLDALPDEETDMTRLLEEAWERVLDLNPTN